MADDQIRYDILTQDALRGVVRKVLSEVARTGLPGEHHFFITFATHAPGVRVSSRLLGRYPEDMTIVLQHQYWDLTVSEHAFEVGLSFNGIPERLLVPFTAVKAFMDPSVQFGVQFEIAAAPGESKAGDEAADDEAESLDEPVAVLPLPGTAKGAQSAPAAGEGEAEADGHAEEKEAPAAGAAQVVSLVAFRKKSS
ncbi:MAG: hypothetical protein J0H08_03465 [Rhizobiales bacterium]|nr:hypothetical protein [Hyphomicrobiales bacterium]